MNALLIYPRFPDTFWGFKHALRLIRKKASSPPLGLLTVASMLPDDWELRLVDDNLIGNRRKLLTELLPALIGWRAGKWGMSFSTQVTVNLADDAELMDLMARAGFDTVFVGIESVDEASLSECNKRQNEHRDLLDDVRRIQRAGMQVQGGFIVGFDHDTPTVRHCDGNGGNAPGPGGDQASQASQRRGSHTERHVWRQRGRNDQHRPHHGCGAAGAGL